MLKCSFEIVVEEVNLRDDEGEWTGDTDYTYLLKEFKHFATEGERTYVTTTAHPSLDAAILKMRVMLSAYKRAEDIIVAARNSEEEIEDV